MYGLFLEWFNASRQTFLPEQGWSGHLHVAIHAVYGYKGSPAQNTGCGNCSLEVKANANRDPKMTKFVLNFSKGFWQMPVVLVLINAANFMAHPIPYPNPDLRNLSPNSTEKGISFAVLILLPVKPFIENMLISYCANSFIHCEINVNLMFSTSCLYLLQPAISITLSLYHNFQFFTWAIRF